jgi:hypothetical protein
MSGLTLERARANHEDIEAYEAAIVAILEDKPRTVRYDHIRVYLLFPFHTRLAMRNCVLDNLFSPLHRIRRRNGSGNNTGSQT